MSLTYRRLSVGRADGSADRTRGRVMPWSVLDDEDEVSGQTVTVKAPRRHATGRTLNGESVRVCWSCMYAAETCGDTSELDTRDRWAVNAALAGLVRQWGRDAYLVVDACECDAVSDGLTDQCSRCEPSFTRASCEGCGEGLSGDRYPATVWSRIS